MAAKPFPIYDMRHGKVTAKEPWLLPQDAFVEMKNACVDKGVIVKRKGYQDFARLVRYYIEWIGTGDGVDVTWSHTLATVDGAHDPIPTLSTPNLPIVPGTFYASVLCVGPVTEVWSDNGAGVLAGDNGSTGTINYTTGAIAMTFAAAPAVADIDVTFSYYPDDSLECMGMTTYRSGANKYLIAAGRKQLNIYTSSALTRLQFAAANTVQAFTGDASQYFWFENWNDILYLTNGKDQMQRYPVSTEVVDYIPTWGATTMTACKMIILHKNRLVFFYTTEGGTTYRQRARWCGINNPDAATGFTTTDYIDCPTDESIMTAGFVGDDLIVFFEDSTWRFAYTGNSDLPFRWETIPGRRGAFSQNCLWPLSRPSRLGVMTETSIAECDNIETRDIDQTIPQYILDFALDKNQYSWGIVIQELNQAWLSLTASGSTYPDRVLVYNYVENTWALYVLPVHCFGSHDLGSGDLPTWDGLAAYLGLPATATIDDVHIAFDERQLRMGFPAILMGGRDGYIYRLNLGENDNGSAIELDIKGGRWNPFAKYGKKADLQCVELMVDKDATCSFDVELYENHNTTPYQTTNVTCTGTGSVSVVKVPVGCISDWHQMRIHHTATEQPLKIHAIIPWFDAVGSFGA